MFCMNCGKEITDGTNFCIYCGTPLHRQIQDAHDSDATNSIEDNLKSARKVSILSCPMCRYIGKMKFVRYKHNFFFRYGVPIIIGIALDKVMPRLFPYYFNFIFGTILFKFWIDISSLNKYYECPNCGRLLFSSDGENIMTNDDYVG